MPRDFMADKALKGMPPLEKSPGNLVHMTNVTVQNMGQEDSKGVRTLHPFTQSLTSKDVESCVRLEEATFPPEQRCSREKFLYRFSKCGELCIGLFTSASPDSEANKLCTAATAGPVLTGEPDRKLVLLAHVIVTKTTNRVVKDEDMAIPEDGQEQSALNARLGHQEQGRTIALHSLAVVPEYQHMGLGKMLLKAYIQRIQASEVADQIALITYERLVPFYERQGFQNRGRSDVKFGGEAWINMVCPLQDWHDTHDSGDFT
ncbi:MAG: hypothetical protein M1821_007888 [Bathelium mastoideum]|nr:MAG: hypothetical protein M1821_007888 [Bathelium mastoideum]KAI9692936.1 MAG: hypothetical protein M1822_004931 [Bathelium mastoideum]